MAERTYSKTAAIGGKRINGTYSEMTDVDVEITIDEAALAQYLAEVAAANSRKTARMADGAIRCRILK